MASSSAQCYLAKEPQPTSGVPRATEASGAQLLLQELLTSSLIRAVDWRGLPAAIQEELGRHTDPQELLAQLVAQNLLTPYQAQRIGAGTTFGLILGNYRVLDHLGAGGMGIVFKAEHLYLPRLVAIKVLPPAAGQDPQLVQRFLAEMWTAAKLQHPNIVSAVDAGETQGPDPDSAILRYFAMDFV